MKAVRRGVSGCDEEYYRGGVLQCMRFGRPHEGLISAYKLRGSAASARLARGGQLDETLSLSARGARSIRCRDVTHGDTSGERSCSNPCANSSHTRAVRTKHALVDGVPGKRCGSRLRLGFRDEPRPRLLVFKWRRGWDAQRLPPMGLCSDVSGKVWIVSDSASPVIIEYAHGGTTPIATLSDPDGQPEGCAVDPSTEILPLRIFTRRTAKPRGTLRST